MGITKRIILLSYKKTMKGHENAQPVRMIFLDTKEEIEFKSVAYASRLTGFNEYTIRRSLNPIAKKRFDYQERKVVFRIKK